VFTGLIQAKGVVIALEPAESGRVLRIDPRGWGHRPLIGESVAINGCCLTVAGTGPSMKFDIVAQTLRMTSLGRLKQGDRVNIEHAATPTSLLGGHIVQGHVDCVGAARRISDARGGERRLRIDPPTDLMEYIVPQGSIAIEGVSLTVASIDDEGFEVALIPTTLERTTLGAIDGPTPVNLEADCLVKAVIHHLKQQRLPAAEPDGRSAAATARHAATGARGSRR
jgi:riboflavin synthase